MPPPPHSPRYLLLSGSVLYIVLGPGHTYAAVSGHTTQHWVVSESKIMLHKTCTSIQKLKWIKSWISLKGQQYLACILRWSSQRKACLDFTDKDINWCVMLFHTLHFLMYVNISFWSTASPLCATVSLTMLSYFSLFFLPALSVCLTLKHRLRCLSSCWRRGCTCHLLSSFHCVCQVATAGQVCNGGDAWQSGLMGHFCKCCSLHLCSQLGSGTVSLPTTKVFPSHKYVQGRQCACQGRYAAGDALREQTMIDQRCGSPGGREPRYVGSPGVNGRSSSSCCFR